MIEASNGKRITPVTAINNFIRYSQCHQQVLQKYSLEFYLNYFDRYAIEELEERMTKKKHNQMQFVRQLTSFILHGADETIFLMMSLIDLFWQMVRQLKKGEQMVTVMDFTHFLCNGISSQQSEITLHTRQVHMERAHVNPTQVRDIDLHAAVVYEHPEKESPKISRGLKKKERRVDSSKPLHIFQINLKRKEIITLGRLSAHISTFDLQLRKVRDIAPVCSRLYSHSAAVMSMAFSQKQQRIGCIITRVGMAFWDYQDDFATEKLIRKVVGDRIYFLPVLEQWVTTTNNAVHLWDLKLQSVKLSFGQSSAIALNYIQQINHLKCLAISFTMKDQHKWVYIYRNDGFKIASRLRLGHIGAQKIHYHRTTQTLLLLGSNELSVYQIDPLSVDLSLLSQLKGHETVITCIADLDDGFVVTGDDRGTLRIWDMNTLRCQQVVKVSKSLSALECLDRNLILADSRLNVLQLQKLRRKVPLGQQFGVSKFYSWQGSQPQVFIFTNVSCRVCSLLDGRVRKVVELCSAEEQIIAVQQLREDFLVSTSRALLFCYSHNLKLKWTMNSPQCREEEILHIRTDPRNKFFTTVTKQGNFHVWCEKSFSEQGPRKSITNMDKKYICQVMLFDQSERFGLMVSGEKIPEVKIWDYQSCKLWHIIQLEAVPCALKLAEHCSLLAIGCPNDKVYLYKLWRLGPKENMLDVVYLQYGNLRYPQTSLNSLLSVESVTQVTNTPRQRHIETKSILSQGIAFFHKGARSVMAVCYGRGNVLVFDISELGEYFQMSLWKGTANVQRPVKEVLEKQIEKSQFRRTEKVGEDSLSQLKKLKANWNKKLHNDIITHIDVLQNTYFSTLALDGYFKIVTIDSGEIVAALSIRHPLPILWKLELSQEEQLCRKVHQVLKLIASILQDKETRPEDRQMFNVCHFMKEICTKNSALLNKRKRKSVRLLKDEMSAQESTRGGEQSLKSMQAFRRVSLIKQSGVTVNDEAYLAQRKYLNSLKSKDEMLKLLSPYRFSNRCSSLLDKQEEQRFDCLIAKSVYASPAHGLDRSDKNRQSKPLFQLINQKSLKKQLGRSMSQTIKSLHPIRLSSLERASEDEMTRKMRAELHRHEPIKAISSFIKNLEKKIPKESQIKKHIKKHSGFIPKI